MDKVCLIILYVLVCMCLQKCAIYPVFRIYANIVVQRHVDRLCFHCHMDIDWILVLYCTSGCVRVIMAATSFVAAWSGSSGTF